MRPQLIVDFSDRTLCALLLTPGGDPLLVSQEVQQMATRALSAEILFDPKPSEDPDFSWEEALTALSHATPSNFFQRAQRLGLRRPWDLKDPAEALQLGSPLEVLSSPAAWVDAIVQPILPAIGSTLLAALLDPVFSFISLRNFALREVEAFAVVPAHTSRRARLVLQKVFRRSGFRRLTLLPRELAITMALLDEAPLECLVWDVIGSDLHLHRVAVEARGARRQFRTMAARTVRGLGWPYWVRQVGTALNTREPSSPSIQLALLDRALASLLNGSPELPGLSSSLPLHLSHGLLHEVLDAVWVERVAAELRSRLEPHLADLDAPGSPVTLLGTACGLEPLQDLFLALSGGVQPPSVAATPALERLARGVAAALLWLREDPARQLVTPPTGSLRLDTLRGETCEVLPAAQLPSPGEECSLRRQLRLAGDHHAAGPVLAHLLWGSDIGPEGNASLCTLPVEIPHTEGQELWLALHLRRSGSGRHLGGTIEIGLEGEVAARASTSFTEDLTAFPLVA